MSSSRWKKDPGSSLVEPDHTIILEEAALELVPKQLLSHRSCALVASRFGVPPEMQILDSNFHREAMRKLRDIGKRGRPDVVHFALLDITSTPLYEESKVRVIIHTRENNTIMLNERVRLPRTLHRFCGVMAKILSHKQSKEDEALFRYVENETLEELVRPKRPTNIVSFSTQGENVNLRDFASAKAEPHTKTVWIVGGFPFGHFRKEVIEISNHVISISRRPLAAHVVTARLSYELETRLGIE